MGDPMLAEYVICRLGIDDALQGDPLTLSAEAACRRDPAKFFKLAIEIDRVWKAYYREEIAKKAQMALPLNEVAQ
jgi:hypothetical protein